MMATSLGIFAVVALFVAAGLLRLGARRGCGSGHCGSCSHDCESDTKDRSLP